MIQKEENSRVLYNSTPVMAWLTLTLLVSVFLVLGTSKKNSNYVGLTVSTTTFWSQCITSNWNKYQFFLHILAHGSEYCTVLYDCNGSSGPWVGLYTQFHAPNVSSVVL